MCGSSGNVSAKPLVWWGLGLAVVVGLVLNLWPREPSYYVEPVYEGKPLNYWLDGLRSIELPSKARRMIMSSDRVVRSWDGDHHDVEKRATEGKAIKAIKALGPRCLPTLLQRLQTRATPLSALKENLRTWAFKRHLVRARFLRISNPPGVWAAEYQRGQAVMAFFFLGETARPVLPQVLALAKSDPDPGVRASAMEVVRYLSPADYAKITRQTNALSAAQ